VRSMNKSGIVGRRLAKAAIPLLTSSMTALRMEGLTRYVEIGAALLQGKGAGSGWDFDAELRAAAQCIRRSNPVLLDVGANHGKWASGMVKLFPGTQKVVLFEPQDECIARLGALDLPGKVIVHGAVGDHAGTHMFFVGPPGWGAASFFHRSDTFFSNIRQRKITVPVFTLDDVMESQEIEFADFVKLDVEGAELFALKGAGRAFCRKAIGALSLEFGAGNINSRTFFRDFWDFLFGHGFEIFRILHGGHMIRIPEYYEDLEYFRGVSNYVARLPITCA
jgi:FkbM family methyltransferase